MRERWKYASLMDMIYLNPSLRFLQIRPELQNVMCVCEFVVLEFIEIVRILLSLLAFVPYSLDQIVRTFSLLYFAD